MRGSKRRKVREEGEREIYIYIYIYKERELKRGVIGGDVGEEMRGRRSMRGIGRKGGQVIVGYEGECNRREGEREQSNRGGVERGK